MPKIPRGRRVGQAAVNAVRTLLEEHDHIVQEISGRNDFGEDFYVTFTDGGDVTSDTVKVQVKGGDSWRRGNGYAVPVNLHGDTWADGNIPVYCVVYDPNTKELYWANATQQLRRFGPHDPPRYIGVSPNAVLDDATMDSFVSQARRYVGRYRGRQAVLTHLGEMSGTEFDPSDHVLHFVNGDDEDLIFWKSPGAAVATLLLSTQGWNTAWVTLESLMRSTPPLLQDGDTTKPTDPDLWTAEELELSQSEIMWVAACFMSTRQADEGPESDLIEPDECEGCPSCTGEDFVEHGRIEADVIHAYVLACMLNRIEAEPDLVQRSILAMRKDITLQPAVIAELGSLETEPRFVRQVNKLSRATVPTEDDIDPGAFRLAVLYLIHRIYVGGPSLPLEEQVRIVWRVPEPGRGPSASMSQAR
ncbi:DUF4365 domain-containing protein [Streptomyces sp. DSM 41987]|uniref:DUF4365 domain-containing protein n=1 Tax=Streptomyces TaxID=1883 RepID=UPI0018DF4C17|nr:DUF4365 domain-containing protein [Streptomyces fildesensis]